MCRCPDRPADHPYEHHHLCISTLKSKARHDFMSQGWLDGPWQGWSILLSMRCACFNCDQDLAEMLTFKLATYASSYMDKLVHTCCSKFSSPSEECDLNTAYFQGSAKKGIRGHKASGKLAGRSWFRFVAFVNDLAICDNMTS